MFRAAPWLLLAALLACAALAYRPALTGPFVLDDRGSIEANMRLREPGVVRIPTPAEMLGPGRPVTEVTFALDWRAAGLEPHRYHLVGLLLHLAAVVAAFGFLSSLLRRAGHPRSRGVALAVAGLFALHPIQVESVAYAAQRAEVLSSLLYLLALWLLDRAAAGWPGWRGALSWAGGVIAWLVGMGAKTIAISAPGAFLLDQAVVAPAADRGAGPLRRRTARALWIAAPLLALAAWSASLHLRSFESNPGGGAGFTATALGAGDYFLTQLRVQWLYLRLLAWPDALAFDRSFTPSAGVDGAVLAAAAGVVALLALGGWLWLRAERADGPRPAERLGAFGILFWFVALAPTSSFVPVADLAVEHRVYLACLGPFLAVAVGTDALLRRLVPRPRAAAAGAAMAALALLSLGLALRARARVWNSEEALWESSASASPGNARAWTNLGLSRSRRGDRAGAEAAYVRAWGVVDNPARAASLARNHAALLIQSGRAVEALTVLDRGMRLAPGDVSLHANRAAALGQLGRLAEALEEGRLAARSAPGDPLMRNLLGQVLTVNGDWPGALTEFQAAEGLDPGEPLYPVSAGMALTALGRRAEACAAFRRAGARSGSRPLPLDAAGRAAALGCPILAP
jgi:Flp pilus assembly protein TadD